MLHEVWLQSPYPFIRVPIVSFSLPVSSATGTHTEPASEDRLACLCLRMFKYLPLISKTVHPGTLHRHLSQPYGELAWARQNQFVGILFVLSLLMCFYLTGQTFSLIGTNVCAHMKTYIERKLQHLFFSFLFFLSSKQIQVLSNLHNNFYQVTTFNTILTIFTGKLKQYLKVICPRL